MIDAMGAHMTLMVNAKTEALVLEYEKKLKKVEAKHAQDLVESYIDSFCRQWIRRKPEALNDFLVYRVHNRSLDDHHEDKVPTLLVGIPGPLNSPWEGGMFPVVMLWANLSRPPKCVFPAIHHCNVYSSGTISVSTLNEECEWSRSYSVPELFFTIQQLLAHPNVDSPAQKEAYLCYIKSREGYDNKAREQAAKFSAEADFLSLTKQAFGSRFKLDRMKLIQDDDYRIHLQIRRITLFHPKSTIPIRVLANQSLQEDVAAHAVHGVLRSGTVVRRCVSCSVLVVRLDFCRFSAI